MRDEALLRSRNRWRAVALALGLGHLVAVIGVYFWFTRQVARLDAEKVAMVAQMRKVEAAAKLEIAQMQVLMSFNSKQMERYREMERQLQEAVERARRPVNPVAERTDVESR